MESKEYTGKCHMCGHTVSLPNETVLKEVMVLHTRVVHPQDYERITGRSLNDGWTKGENLLGEKED